MIELLIWMFFIAWATFGMYTMKEFIKHNWNIFK